jgi:DNA-binding PadR family transcriptional regulator
MNKQRKGALSATAIEQVGEEDAQRVDKHLPVPAYRYLVLASLMIFGRMSGYKLIRTIEELTDGIVRISTPTLYENLARLRCDGLVERTAITRDKGVYDLTDEGRALLDAERGIRNQIEGRLRTVRR